MLTSVFPRGSDLWYYSSFDERWRMVATYRSTDANPKERLVHHQAGAGGEGDSSYIDLVAFQEKDTSGAWTDASDGTYEERLYYCQNQHADVVALVTNAGAQREMVRYSAYGVPIGLPVGDVNSDGACLQADQNQVRDWALATPAVYDVRGDLDLDGDVDLTDRDTLRDNYKGITLWRKALSAIGNLRGFCGSDYHDIGGCVYGGRLRPFRSEVGLWAGRDIAGYVDGASLYQYTKSQPLVWRDPTGMFAVSAHQPPELPVPKISSTPTKGVCVAGMSVEDGTGGSTVAGFPNGKEQQLSSFSKKHSGQGINFRIQAGFKLVGNAGGECRSSDSCNFEGHMSLAFEWEYSDGVFARTPPTSPADRKIKTKANMAIHGILAVKKNGELRTFPRIWPKWTPSIINVNGKTVVAGSTNVMRVSESLTCGKPTTSSVRTYTAELPDNSQLVVSYAFLCGCDK